MLEYKQLMKGSDGKNCIYGCSKYFARLAQGHKRDITEGTNTYVFNTSKRITKEKETNLPLHLRKLSTTKKISLMCMISLWWKSNQFPRRNLHNNC